MSSSSFSPTPLNIITNEEIAIVDLNVDDINKRLGSGLDLLQAEMEDAQATNISNEDWQEAFNNTNENTTFEDQEMTPDLGGLLNLELFHK